jgi:hypothetical protein
MAVCPISSDADKFSCVRQLELMDQSYSLHLEQFTSVVMSLLNNCISAEKKGSCSQEIQYLQQVKRHFLSWN